MTTPTNPAPTNPATESGPVYDPNRDLYIDPRTGEEDEHSRRLRLIEESSPGAFWGEK